MKNTTIAAALLLLFLLAGCATTTTTHFDSTYDSRIESLLVIVGFQSSHGPFGLAEDTIPDAPLFLPAFEAELMARWEQDGVTTTVDAVTVDGQVELARLLSEAEPDAILLVEQTAEGSNATYSATLFDAEAGERIWEGAYDSGRTDAEAIAQNMHKRVNQGLRRSDLAVF